MKYCVFLHYTEAYVILSWITAEMKRGGSAARDARCSPSPALGNENQDRKGRDRKLTEHVCAISSLSAVQSVPAC